MNYYSIIIDDIIFFSNLSREKTRVEEANNEDSQEFERFSNGKWWSDEKGTARSSLGFYFTLLTRPPS